MNKIFIDLEMHPVARAYNEPFKMLKKETIEIGAVMLDEQLHEISSFKEFVRPSFVDKVYPKYQKLTGITTEMLEYADCFQSVFKRFCDWCGQDYIVYSWGEDDIWQLMREYQYKGIVYSKEIRYMFNHWKDYQAEFGSLLNLKRQLSLSDAVLVGGLDFAGRAHDGLVDARNTANLFRQTSDSGSDDFKRLLQNIEEARRPCTFSLKEILDFNQFLILQQA